MKRHAKTGRLACPCCKRTREVMCEHTGSGFYKVVCNWKKCEHNPETEEYIAPGYAERDWEEGLVYSTNDGSNIGGGIYIPPELEKLSDEQKRKVKEDTELGHRIDDLLSKKQKQLLVETD